MIFYGLCYINSSISCCAVHLDNSGMMYREIKSHGDGLNVPNKATNVSFFCIDISNNQMHSQDAVRILSPNVLVLLFANKNT